jgi:hypothetical protein
MMDVFTSPLDFELCNIIEVVVAEPLASTHTSFAFPPTTGTSEDLFFGHPLCWHLGQRGASWVPHLG